jgi:hypothetical protein
LIFLNYGVGALILYWAHKRLAIFSTISTFTFFFAGMFVFQVVGLPFSGGINELLNRYAVAPHVKYLQFVLIHLAMMSVILGAGLARMVDPRVVQMRHYFTRGESRVRRDQLQYGVALMAGVYAVACLFWIARFPFSEFGYNIVAFLTGAFERESYYATRHGLSAVLRERSGVLTWIVEKTLYGTLPFLVIYTVYAYVERLRLRHVLMGAVGIIAYANLLIPQKSRLVLFVAYVGLGILIARRGRSVLLRGLVAKTTRAAAVIAVSTVLVALLYTRQYGFDLRSGLLATGYRLFVENPRVVEIYLDYYPLHHPHLHGGTSALVGAVLGNPGHSPAVYLPQIALGRSLTTWPTTYVANAWVDFGLVGVVVYSLIIGVVLALIDRWMRQSEYAIGRSAAFGAAAFCCVGFGMNSMFTTFLNGGVLLNIVNYAAAVTVVAVFYRSPTPDHTLASTSS